MTTRSARSHSAKTLLLHFRLIFLALTSHVVSALALLIALTKRSSIAPSMLGAADSQTSFPKPCAAMHGLVLSVPRMMW